MRSMSEHEIAHALAGPWQAVLSLNRRDRGPLAVPMSYFFEDGKFWMITPKDSLPGRLMEASGRATMTVHQDEVTPRSVEQWYVMAEGAIRFTDDDPERLLREIMIKDRGPRHAYEWVSQSLPNVTTVAVLSPERLSGYHGVSQLD